MRLKKLSVPADAHLLVACILGGLDNEESAMFTYRASDNRLVVELSHDQSFDADCFEPHEAHVIEDIRKES